ncbi:MAG: hypothetical protein A2075_09630 [Geobacteraceae bacterium GWC2_58_44]|nr:MAG: hypothetical protein A2075_09630 [Geobacteraceae bacterium GWC2_58_44]HBG05687.1 hypothetical protein [Geobacter sp.]
MTFEAKTPLAIFLCSLASLAFEVALTRIFSISLWYHFAFMIISIAMLGLAASGVALALYPRLKRIERVGSYCLLLGVAIPLSYLLVNQVPFDPVRLAWDRTQILHLGLFYLILAVPFFCTGLVIATAFTVQSGRAGLLYGADLLGAGLGSLGVLLLLSILAPERVVFLLCLAPLAAAFFSGGPRLRVAALLLACFALLLLARQPEFAALRISPYKGMPSALRFPGARALKSYDTPFARIDTFESPAVRFAPGLSLSYLESLPRQIGIAVDGGDVSAVTASDRQKAPEFLEFLPAALPYAIGSRNKVLVLDPRGGLQVLLARRFGAAEIDKVEGNPALAAVLRTDLREFAGGIYDDRSWTGLGRSWLRGREDAFDIIDISLMGTEPYGTFGIAEEYRFTVEAFKEYLGSLGKDGLLSVNLYIIPPPRSELRILATMIEALEEIGVREPALHLAAIRSWGALCIVAKRSPLTESEIGAIRRFAGERWFDLLHYPGMGAQQSDLYLKSSADEYNRAFAALLSKERRQRFLDDYIFDVAPVHDDRPFFGYFLKAGRTAETYRAMGEKWQFFLAEGYIVPAVFAQAALISLLLMLLPLFSGKRGGGRAKGLLPYFALLGCGFMLVEIALIQKIILPLENPSYAVATLLASLLVSSGAGSLLGERFAWLRTAATTAVIAGLIVCYSLILPAASAAISTFALPVKIGLVFLLLLPLGLLMGIPFPAGLRTLGDLDPFLIPWAWVLNGTFSVLAPMLAVMFATSAGFGAVLYLGAAAYLLAFLNLHFFAKKLRITSSYDPRRP